MRIIFNTTFIFPNPLSGVWITLVKETLLPLIQTQKGVKDVIFSKVDIEQPDGDTFSLQIVFQNEQDYIDYTAQGNLEVIGALENKFANQYLCFSSTMYEL